MAMDGREDARATQVPDLHRYDEPSYVSLDESVWHANIEALSARQPALADRLRGVTLPAHWRPATTSDGQVDFRVDQTGESSAWLGGSAIPKHRADARLQPFDPTGKNPAISTATAVWELAWLLRWLPRQTAVYVFERDEVRLVAALRLKDVSREIGDGRCIIVPPGEERAFLKDLMARESGLMPPGTILLPDYVSEQRVEALRVVCEEVHATTAEQRAARLEALDRREWSGVGEEATPRLAVLALSMARQTHALAEELAAAAKRLGWPALTRVAAGPADIHPLCHGEALAEFEPVITVCVGHPRSALPMKLSGQGFVWVFHPRDVPAELEPNVRYLAATPAAEEALRAKGVSRGVVSPWYWACGEDVAADTCPAVETKQVVVVGNLPDIDPERYGVRQASQQYLWQRAREVVARSWETGDVRYAEGILRTAEREARITLTDKTLRTTFAEHVQRVLIPAGVLEGIVAALADGPLEVLTVGRGWDRLRQSGLRAVGTTLREAAGEMSEAAPRACVFVTLPDVLSADVLLAAGRGWPLLLYGPGGKVLAAELGDVLRPEEHFRTFGSGGDMWRALESTPEAVSAAREVAACTQEHVRTHHMYEHRLCELRTLVS